MKKATTFKKSLLIGTIILAIWSENAFAATSINNKNNDKNYYSSNHESLDKNQKQTSKAFDTNSKITPIQTLALLLGDTPQEIENAARKDFLDIYQYAQKKGVLNKYKAQRLVFVKNNIQKSIDNKEITKKEGSQILAKVQYNIFHERSETRGISFDYNSQNNCQSKNLINHKKSPREIEIVTNLKTAIKNNEFFLVYQPQVDLKTGKTIGMEALLRWNSKKLGSIPPGIFIPIAEKNNLMIEIGNWVTNNVCKDLDLMNNNSPKEIKGLRCSINFSALQLADDNFVENLLSIINKYKVNYNQIEVEITESLLLQNLQKNQEMLKQLTDLGITVALDDFGTGYSSFSYLLDLPINQIKIDRRFIKDYPQKDDGTLIKILVDMSKKLNKNVLIEGAETLEQINFLKSIDSDYIQGYYYSKPLLKKDFIEFVKNTNS